MLSVGPDEHPDRYELVSPHSGGGEGELWRGQLRLDGLILPVAIKIAHVAVTDPALSTADSIDDGAGFPRGGQPSGATFPPSPAEPNAAADHRKPTSSAGPPQRQGDSPAPSSGSNASRWRMQAELLRTLDHPGLVRVREVFEGAAPHPPGAVAPGTSGSHEGGSGPAGRRLYLAMNWVDGRNGARLVAEEPDRSLRDVLQVVQQLADAVDHLHLGKDTGGIPILHRDIKPANLILDGTRLWLVDFGLVRPSRSQTMTVAGTLAYLAPEILEGEPFTPASDRYAVGATTYYLLTGRNPRLHRPDETSAVLAARVAGPGAAELTDLVLAMLDPNPDRRPALATAWATELGRAAGEGTTLTADVAATSQGTADEPLSKTALRLPIPSRDGHAPTTGPIANSETVATTPRRMWWLLSVVALTVALASGAWWLVDDPLPRAGEQDHTWERTSLPHGTDAIGGVPLAVTTYAGGVIVAGAEQQEAGPRAAVWRATEDGAWVPLQADESGFPGYSVILDISSTDTTLVATGAVVIDQRWQPSIWTSQDGRAWSQRCCLSDEYGSGGAVKGVAAGPTGIIAVGRRDGRATVWRSADGNRWRELTAAGAFPPGSDLEAVTALSNGGWTAVGVQDGNATVWRSGDGDVWNETTTLPQGSTLNDVTELDGVVVAVGTTEQGRPGMWSQQPGQSWIRGSLPDDVAGQVWATTTLHGQLLAVGELMSTGPDNIAVWHSPDGATWTLETQRPLSADNAVGAAFAVTASDQDLIIVGSEASHDEEVRAWIWQSPLRD